MCSYLRFHPSDLQFSTLPQRQASTLFYGRSACCCSRAIVCLFVCYLALNLMTVESDSFTESWSNVPSGADFGWGLIKNSLILCLFFLRGIRSHSLCTSLDNQVSFKSNWNVKYLHAMYKYAIRPYSAFFLPPFLLMLQLLQNYASSAFPKIVHRAVAFW